MSTSSGWRLFRRFSVWLRPDRKLAAGIAGLALLALPFGVISPLVARHLFDQVLPRGDQSELLRVCLWMILLTVAGSGIGFIESIVALRLRARIRFRVSHHVHRHLFRLPLAYFQASPQGELMSRLRDDVRGLDPLMTDQLLDLALALLRGVLFLCLMVWVDPGLALTGFVLVAVLCIGMVLLAGPLRRRSKAARDADAEGSASLHEAVAGMLTTRTAAMEARERRRYFAVWKAALRKAVRRDVFGGAAGTGVGMVLQVGIYLILAVGAYQITRGASTLGNLIAFFLYLVQMTTSAGTLLGTIPAIQQALACLDRVFQVLDEVPEAQPAPDHGPPPARIRGDVEFRAVSFAYDTDVQALRQISFHVAAGQVVALVGPSGGGKSTLVQLLPRLFDPQEGAILLDGKDVRDLPLDHLRGQIGVVPQDVFLFNRTIAENLAYAAPEATPEQIEEAARAAAAHEFIEPLPAGYQTVVGERGVKLSAGQKQRIAIARELLRDPPLLILDEATSHLDALNEAAVRTALRRLMRGRTAFVIAHRLSTIHEADRILVLKEGQIVESGTHEELLAEGGLYRELHDKQFLVEPSVPGGSDPGIE